MKYEISRIPNTCIFRSLQVKENHLEVGFPFE